MASKGDPFPSSSPVARGIGEDQLRNLPAKDSRKSRDDYELLKSRLSDQSFSFAEFPDPLLPRRGPHPKQYPRGTTVETEQRLQSLITKIKADGY
ncbi:hypothetical protein VTK73DRAFT_9503 [Phialemonium thermophilum]|uniref:Uncharacterized protein n=1 Tax=Phialemonium thermophilum TaxID=223376 RepID=A0ABR3Y5C4_9PEZI